MGERVSSEFIEENVSRLESLFAHLDPGHAEIGPLVAQWNSGEQQAAAEGLSAYFESKSLSTDFLDKPNPPRNLDQHAVAALQDIFYILGAWEQVPTGKDGHLDWSFQGERHDREVAWMLNRHEFIPILAAAYQKTGDINYRRKLNSAWSDWIVANPYPHGLSFSSQWRALETARRILNSWVYVFYEHSFLDAETRLLILSSVPDHADSLHKHASFWGGNHLLSEKLALLTLSHSWPEFKNSAEWESDAIEILTEQIFQQTYPDGSYKELSNHYQRVVLVSSQNFIRLLASIDPEFASLPIVARIQEMWNFFALSMRPDGYGPLNNASDLDSNTTFVQNIWKDYDRPDWLYIATNGKLGDKPEGRPSILFPWAGQAFIRDSWDRKADWIYFDAGPYGTAHQHVDRMHLSVVLDGRPLLVDGGRYTYKPGPWKDYFRGPGSHNILLLDGKAAEQAPREVVEPLPVYFEERDEVIMTAAQSRFTGQSPTSLLPSLRSSVPWTRAVLYDKRGFVLILDHLVCFENRKVTAYWNFHPDIGQDLVQGFLQSGSGDLRERIQKGSMPPHTGGFHSLDYNLKVPSIRMVHEGDISGPTTFSWLIQPADTDPLSIEVSSPSGAPVMEFSISRAGQPLAEAQIQLYPRPALLRYQTVGPDSQN